MKDLDQNLLGGKGKKGSLQMKKRFQQCDIKIKTLRNKNNQLQKQCDNELDNDIRAAVKSQTSFIQNEISNLKRCLESLAKDFTDPGSKKKIKELCNVASREMERNRRIMGDFLSRASTQVSYLKKQSTLSGFRRSRTEFEKDLPSSRQKGLHPVQEGQSDVFASEDHMSDIRAQQRMMAQKTALIKELQSKNNRIKSIIDQMGSMIGGQQKDMVNQMGDNIQETNQNVLRANDELEQAQLYQKKSKKKYVCIVTTIIILFLIIAGMIYFFVAK